MKNSRVTNALLHDAGSVTSSGVMDDGQWGNCNGRQIAFKRWSIGRLSPLDISSTHPNAFSLFLRIVRFMSWVRLREIWELYCCPVIFSFFSIVQNACWLIEWLRVCCRVSLDQRNFFILFNQHCIYLFIIYFCIGKGNKNYYYYYYYYFITVHQGRFFLGVEWGQKPHSTPLRPPLTPIYGCVCCVFWRG